MSIVFAATRSTEEFAKVKAGLQGSEPLPYDYLGWFLLGVLVVVLASIAVSVVRRRRIGAMFRGWTSIGDPSRIAAILKRSVARQANCTLEIFDHQHTSVYRGQVFEARPGLHLILELSRLPGPDVDFEGFPCQMHLIFRPSPKEAMEHYQFSSHTLALHFEREKSWRVARVAVAWPKNLISAQRRDFLRLEPLGEHAMVAALAPAPAEPPENLDEWPALAEGAIMDLSIGGVQMVFAGALEPLEAPNYLLTVDLPLAGLEVEIKHTRLHLFFQPLSRDLIGPAAGVPASPADHNVRTIVRGSFTGRYWLHPDSGHWVYQPFGPETFQDLAHWIHAYQRFLLKKEKGLTAAPEDRVNIYPSTPPKA